MKKTLLAILIILSLNGCGGGGGGGSSSSAPAPVTYEIDFWNWIIATSRTKWFDGYSYDINNNLTATFINLEDFVESKSDGTGLLVNNGVTTYDRYDDNITNDNNETFTRFLNYGDNVTDECILTERKNIYSIQGYTFTYVLMVNCEYSDKNVTKAYQYDRGLVSIYTDTNTTKSLLVMNGN